MTDSATTPATKAAAADDRVARSQVRQIVHETLARPGARIGAAWIAVVAFFAVFGPFLASSHPYVMKTANGLEFPLFRNLGAADVVVPLIAIVSALLWFNRTLRARTKWFIFLASILGLSIGGALLIEAPLTARYKEYRQMERDGAIEWAVRAPIPYSPSDRLRDYTRNELLPPAWLMNDRADKRAREGFNHFLGTERNGADVLSRIIHASRIAFAIGFIATSIALTIGVFLGGLMGYFAKFPDLLGMRLVEIFEAIPQFFLLLTLVAVLPNRGPEMLYFMMIIIGFTSWTGYARFTRAEFLKLRKQDYVQAAIACGLPLRSVLFRHMLPNGVAPVLVTASFGIASAILLESTLSFLGLGIVDQPSWGQMLAEATEGGFNWWMAVFPGGAIFLTVFAYNLIGEALRDAIDPHLKKSAHM